MDPLERKAVFSLASIYAMRMLGLFMILPVFAIFAGDLTGSTPLLLGVALGSYGLAQAALQIPYGLLSDRFGRKPLIVIGLSLFALGSVVAAMSDTIWGVIIGRLIQGSGAISAVVTALAADLTREEHRMRAMALIGMSIGASFLLSMVLGPVLGAWVGLQGLFWLTGALALGAMGALAMVPTPVVTRRHRDTQVVPRELLSVFANSTLLRLDLGIFILHMVMTATFVALPLMLLQKHGLGIVDHWQLYVPVMLLSVLGMFPLVLLAEKHRRIREVSIFAIVLMLLSEAVLALFGGQSYGVLYATLVFYFVGFNVLEASMPSMISKVAPAGNRGSAMGVYSTFQFLGAFLGGGSGGWLMGAYGPSAVFTFCVGALLVWVVLNYSLPPLPHLSTHLFRLDGAADGAQISLLTERLGGIPGVEEVMVVAGEGVAYLKVDSRLFDEESLSAVAAVSV
ncbi:MAG: MFS transporter [Gammaproteobacteria bacterium]|nr:MFS transporter [Gammaproteobacteria bacterium]